MPFPSPGLYPSLGLDDPYFTVGELRARYSEVTSQKYADDVVEARRSEVEERLEKLCDVAFVTRQVTETLSGTGGGYLPVHHTKPITVTAAQDATSTIDVTDAVVAGGAFYLPTGWNAGVSNLTVTYTHGYPEPPVAVKEAAMLWTRELLVKGPISDRRTQIPTEDGGTINLATPGLFGSTTGIPAVDEVIAEYRQPAFVG